ncbi:MAG: hypothetical protein SO170_02220 [Butyribacter sp.]|nr:hypothetical protein [bacterium]MDY3853769.1 hypothetical protein [Butyribacter sp.]
MTYFLLSGAVNRASAFNLPAEFPKVIAEIAREFLKNANAIAMEFLEKSTTAYS